MEAKSEVRRYRMAYGKHLKRQRTRCIIWSKMRMSEESGKMLELDTERQKNERKKFMWSGIFCPEMGHCGGEENQQACSQGFSYYFCKIKNSIGIYMQINF